MDSDWIPGTHDVAVEVRGSCYCYSVLKGGGGAMGRSCCFLNNYSCLPLISNMDLRSREWHIHLARTALSIKNEAGFDRLAEEASCTHLQVFLTS